MQKVFIDRFLVGGFIICLLSLVGCENQSHKGTSKEAVFEAEVSKDTLSTTKPSTETSVHFQAQMKQVWDAYLSIKDALVASDAQQTSQKAATFLTILGEIDTTSLNNKAKEVWQIQADSLTKQALTIQRLNTVDQQRSSFEPFSTNVYQLVKQLGVGSATIYKQYCPMALNDKGAFWLSADSDIKNPYFGDQMLECGEVKEIITFQ